MFTVSVSTGFLVYLFTMGAALVAAVSYERWRASDQAWRLPEEQLCHCPQCSLTFIVERTGTTARCPRCSRLCTVRRRQA